MTTEETKQYWRDLVITFNQYRIPAPRWLVNAARVGQGGEPLPEPQAPFISGLSELVPESPTFSIGQYNTAWTTNPNPNGAGPWYGVKR